MKHATGNRLHTRDLSRRGVMGGAAALGAGATLAACGGTTDSGGDAEVPTGESTGTLRALRGWW